MIKTLNFIYYYLFLASAVLLLQVLLYEVYVITDFNLFDGVFPEGSKLQPIVGGVINFMFFVSLYNIPICGISGIVLLAKRKRVKLGILCLSSAIIFCLYLRQLGDSF